MRALAIVMLLCLGACASLPPHRIEHRAPRHRVMVIEPVKDEKPATFRERWFDRFMKHKRRDNDR
jgi:hypothetical protein